MSFLDFFPEGIVSRTCDLNPELSQRISNCNEFLLISGVLIIVFLLLSPANDLVLSQRALVELRSHLLVLFTLDPGRDSDTVLGYVKLYHDLLGAGRGRSHVELELADDRVRLSQLLSETFQDLELADRHLF